MNDQEMLEQHMDSISKQDDEAFLNAPDDFELTENISEEEDQETETQEKESFDNEESTENSKEEEDHSENTNEDETEEDKDTENDSNEKENLNDESLSYKETHDKIFQPFKANGRDIQVKNVDEAIRLMQMGVGFHRKMSELKPAMSILRTLEQNKLLDEDKIKLFIDLNNKNPEAIKHFMKENQIDPMEIDMDHEGKYNSEVNMVSEKEIDLENVLSEVKDHEQYSSTMSSINKWDQKSHSILSEHPQIIPMLIEQKQNGVFDMILGEVEKMKAMGELQGYSNIESYKIVGDRIQAQGGFDHLIATNDKAPTDKLSETEPKTNKVSKQDEDRNSRRKQISARVSKSSDKEKVMTIEDYANLNDDDFMKV